MTTITQSRSAHWRVMRFAIAPGLLGASVVLLWVAAEQLALQALISLVVLDLMVSLLTAFAIGRGWPSHSGHALRLATDVVVILGCAHITGGLESRLLVLLFVPVAGSAYELHQKGVLATSIGAAALLFGYALLSASGRVDPIPFRLRPGVVDNGGMIAAQTLISLILVVGYAASELAGDFGRRTRALLEGRKELDQMRRETCGILDNMGSGVLTINHESRVDRINPAASRILGLDDSEVQGQDVESALGPRMPILVAHLEECVHEGRVADRTELHVDRGNNETVPLGLSVYPLENDTGDRSGAVAVFQDLSGVVRLRDRMRANDRLAAMGELSATIAHEIRNPLASIRGSVELLEGELELEAENARLFALIRRESARLNQLVEDFLEYARLRPLQPRNTGLNEVLETLAHMVRSRDDLGQAAKVDLHLPHHEVIVHIDEELIQQVFLNLALNAFDAMDRVGTLTISVGLGTGPTPRAIVRFLDAGPGIEESRLEQVFEPFFTTKPHGTGLGLPLANRIVVNHEGEIVVRNIPGAGAEFAVHLPLVGVMHDGELKRGAEAMVQLIAQPT